MNHAILTSEIKEEFLHILRNPAALFFSMGMPVGFFALTAGMFGEEMELTGLATYGAFAVILVVMLNPGIGIAEARDIGWLRIKRASGTPIGVTLAAKVAAAVPYAVGTLLAMVGTAAALGALEVDPGPTALVIVGLVVGALPFSLFGLAVGARLTSNATAAALNAVVFPMVIAAGLWFPLEMLPEFIQDVVSWIPAYHLGQIGTVMAEGGTLLPHVGAMALTGAVGAIAAGAAYRSARL